MAKMFIEKDTFNIFYERDIRLQDKVEDIDYFEVDELMAPIIIILNKKGYVTEYCCSGHLANTKFDNKVTGINIKCYIKFKNIYKFPKLPKSFELKESKYNGMQLYKVFSKDDNMIERFNNMLDSVKELLEWAKELE